MRILSIVGRKKAGKTTLVVALARELRRRGLRVMSLKHAHHAALLDTEGTDSFRHFNEGEVERTVLASPDLRVVFERREDTTGPEDLARRYCDGADIVLAEGFSRHPLPKIEVYRKEVGPEPLYRQDAPNAGEWVGVVTDDPNLRCGCLTLRFQDTMWLHLLATVAWEQAKVLD